MGRSQAGTSHFLGVGPGIISQYTKYLGSEIKESHHIGAGPSDTFKNYGVIPLWAGLLQKRCISSLLR